MDEQVKQYTIRDGDTVLTVEARSERSADGEYWLSGFRKLFISYEDASGVTQVELPYHKAENVRTGITAIIGPAPINVSGSILANTYT